MTFDEALERLKIEWTNPFRFARICVEMANGRFIAGHILAQIVYWTLPGKSSAYKTKLRVIKRSKLDGQTYPYLAKSHRGFALELGVTERQLRTAMDRLEGVVDRIPSKTQKEWRMRDKQEKVIHPQEQILIVEIFRFNRFPTRHIRINWEVFFEKYDEAKDVYEEKLKAAKEKVGKTVWQEGAEEFYKWE